MAKSKRKPSAAQRDKVAIEVAKVLKRKGILSKQTKLHGGKYISKGVLKKVRDLQFVYQYNYTSVKVPKSLAKQARDEGYVVSNGRVVVPARHDFIKRVKDGVLGGVRPIRGGVMEEVNFPFTVANTQEAVDRLENGSLDKLKNDDEIFAFTFSGNLSYATFSDTEAMRQYLQHYRLDSHINLLRVYRLNAFDQHELIPTRMKRPKNRGSQKRSQDRRGGSTAYQRRQAMLQERFPKHFERIRKERAEKWQKRKNAMTKAERAAYNEAGRKRAAASRARKKNNPN